MNPKVIRLLVIFTCAALVLSGCLPDPQASHLGAGAVLYTVPDLVRSEQKSVLEYLTTSSRLTSLPPSAAWSLDKATVTDGEYRFCSGDWLMIIYQAAADDGEQQVVIIDTVHDSSWCGYIKPDGQIIDSCYRR
jgi:hypothetical protein